MDTKVLLFVLFLSIINVSNAQLRCYTCGFSSMDTDKSCLTISNSTPTVNCYFNYCTIYRQEFIDPAGEVVSFLRGCEQAPDYLNNEVSDPVYRTFYRACTNNLCNIGDGIQSVVGGNLSPTPEYNGNNLLVPGTAAATISTISFVTLLSMLVFMKVLN